VRHGGQLPYRYWVRLGQIRYKPLSPAGRPPIRGWRWLVVLTGVAVLCCLPVLVSTLPASVPNLTPRQLEQRILGSQRMSFAGYAESNATFGLPPLPAFSSVTPLLDGVTRMRVWQASPTDWRVDTLSDTGEDDTYQIGGNEYTWDSGEELLTGIFGTQDVRLPRAADLVPSALAVRVIQEAGPGARLRILPPQRVAGQSAAGLAVTPANPESTIGQVDIWAAPDTGLPLLVDIFSRDSASPALETQFLQVGPWQPSRNILIPQRGPGTGFTSTTPANFSGVLNNLDDEVVLPASLGGLPRRPSPIPQIGVYGSGLTSFAVLAFRPGTGGQLLDDALSAGATRLSDSRGTGALASAPLVNLVLMHPYASPDTFLLVGLVSKDALERAAATLIDNPDQDQ
jgi:hypothetical protein